MGEALLGATIGAVVGGLLSLVGSIVAGRRELTRSHRVQLVLVEIPAAVGALGGNADESFEDVFFRIRSVAAIAGPRDARQVDALDDDVAKWRSATASLKRRVLDHATGQLVDPHGGSTINEGHRQAEVKLIVDLAYLSGWFQDRLSWRWWSPFTVPLRRRKRRRTLRALNDDRASDSSSRSQGPP